MDEEKEKLVKALRMGEELRRRTGRTTRVVHEAVKYVMGTGEPAVLVGFSTEEAAALVEVAHEKIDRCVGSTWPEARVKVTERLKALVTGCAHQRRDSLRGTGARVFEDHFVMLERAIEAVQAL